MNFYELYKQQQQRCSSRILNRHVGGSPHVALDTVLAVGKDVEAQLSLLEDANARHYMACEARALQALRWAPRGYYGVCGCFLLFSAEAPR